MSCDEIIGDKDNGDDMILVCGEDLIDMFVSVRGDGSLNTEPVMGGSPYNVAIGLARLGTKTGFLGGLSTDAFGIALTRLLEKEGVDLRYAPRFTNPSTLVIVSVDQAGVPAYRFIGEGAADRALTLPDLPAQLPASVAALTFGSLSMGVEPTGSTLLALAQREKGNRVISVDPNLRASVVGDIGRWKIRLENFISSANIVKSSIEDIEGTYGVAASVDDVAQGWLKLGPSLVVVTRGDKGSTGYHAAGHKIETPGRKVKVIDTVGAGDTFHGALLHHFESTKQLTPSALAGLGREELASALVYAAAAAAVTCTRRGADMPRAADVEAELAR
jgi:fructokinase